MKFKTYKSIEFRERTRAVKVRKQSIKLQTEVVTYENQESFFQKKTIVAY